MFESQAFEQAARDAQKAIASGPDPFAGSGSVFVEVGRQRALRAYRYATGQPTDPPARVRASDASVNALAAAWINGALTGLYLTGPERAGKSVLADVQAAARRLDERSERLAGIRDVLQTLGTESGLAEELSASIGLRLAGRTMVDGLASLPLRAAVLAGLWLDGLAVVLTLRGAPAPSSGA